jgi:hypothetical protein
LVKVVEYKKSVVEDITFPVSKLNPSADYRSVVQLKEGTLKKFVSGETGYQYTK